VLLGKNFLILQKTVLAPHIFSMWIQAPDIARKFEPGQFVIVRLNEVGERIPLTIVDADVEGGRVLLLVQVVGRSTTEMSQLNAGDTILDVVGPLGLGIHVEKFSGKCVCVGGGIGIAPLYPKAKALKIAGNHIVSILGARSKDLLVLEAEMRGISDECIVCTDDGSYGRKALVTEPLREVLEKGDEISEVIAIGPPIMMKFVCKTTAPFPVKTWVSLNPIMIDGTGMCGGCRVTSNGNVRFACVDGPVFDGQSIDWEEMLSRLQTFSLQETEAQKHYCRMRSL
jgi:ferredoxin/flavodoxin---NADP+ reductase